MRTVEAIHLRNLSALVVPSQQRHFVRISAPGTSAPPPRLLPVHEPRLERQQQRDRLQAVVPAVDKVALRVACGERARYTPMNTYVP